MILAPIPHNEAERLASLKALNILDTPPEERFDRITRLVSRFFETPIAYVSLIDKNRQWFKSKQGFDVCETPRDISFCSHTILREEPLIIPDATKDERFQGNPVVAGPPGLRFYAGTPLSGPNGYKIGSLCVLDLKPREFDAKKVEALKDFAKMVEHELNLMDIIKLQSEFLQTKQELIRSQNTIACEMAEAAQYVRDLLPPKLNGELAADWQFVPSSNIGGDTFGYHWLDNEHFAIYLLDVTGHGVTAALLSISVMNVLRSRSLPLTDFRQPGKVLSVLNDIFQMDLHGNRSFTIWYGVYSKLTHRLVYSNAGHPPAILMEDNPKNGVVIFRRLEKGGVMIGCMPGMKYESEVLDLASQSRLLVFSDGIFEIKKSDGSRGNFEDFVEVIKSWSLDGRELESLLIQTRQKLGLNTEDAFEDDISLVEVRFPAPRRLRNRVQKNRIAPHAA